MAEQAFPAPKMLDIEITNTFPLIALGDSAFLLRPNTTPENISAYDHVAIPPDLRVHLSGPDHIFFNAEPLWAVQNPSQPPLAYCFTFVGLPYSLAVPIVKPGETKTWYEAMIISPFHDRQFNSATRLFIDFFVHRLPIDNQNIQSLPTSMPNMRFVGDQSGYILGPFDFDGLQRREKLHSGQLAFSIRFGYVEMENNNSTYLYTPLNIFQRRPKKTNWPLYHGSSARLLARDPKDPC
jgi:hypothetical protein